MIGRRDFLKSVLATSATLLLSACGGSAPPAAPSTQPGASTKQGPGESTAAVQKGGQLLDSLLSEPDSLDPHKGTLLVTTYVLNLIYDRLVYIDQDRKPQPWLAESWEVGDQGRSITFKLRSGLKFQDGTSLDARAVKFTFDRLVDAKTASPNKNQIGPLQETAVLDDTTIRMTWSKPYAPAFVMLDGSQLGIVSPTAVEKHGEQFGRNPVGSGPFKLKRWDAGKELLFERNPDYKNFRKDVQNSGPTHVDEVSIRLVPEEGTRMAALESGELQLAWAPVQEVETLRRNPNMQVYTREKGTSWEYIEFNASKPPFNDKALRRAVGYALKPDEILAASYIYADPIKSPLPIGTPGYDAEVGEQYGFTHDLEKARALLGEAGYVPGAGAVVAKGGTPLQITLTTWNAPQATRAAQVVQSQLKAIGIEARLETMDAGAFLAKLREGDFELAFNRTTWPDPIILSNTFKSPGRDKQYSNPELDTVLEQIEVTVDPAQRQEAVKTAQRMLLEDAAVVPLFADQFMMAGRKEVRDFRFSALGLPMYQDVWLARS